MHRIRRPRLIAVLTALLLLSGLPVAATPIVEVNDAGVRILTVPGTGTIPANGGVATEINDNNWIVVEEATWADYSASPPISREGGLLWKGTGVAEPFAREFMRSNMTSKFDVTDMNESGQIVGNLRLNGTTVDRMFHWDETAGFSYIAYPPSIDSVTLLQEVMGIDNSGTITGWYRPDTNLDPCGDNYLICGFVGDPDSLEVIPDSTFSPTAISDGLVVGNGKTWTAGGGLVDMTTVGVASAVNTGGAFAGTVNSGGINVAAYWASPTSPATIIGTLPGDSHSQAYGINDAGWVVGWSGDSTNPNDPRQAFLWRPGVGIEPLGFLPGGAESAAYDVNNNGLIVGEADGRAVIWDTTGTFEIEYPDPVLVDPIGDVTVEAGGAVGTTATASGAGYPIFQGIYAGVPGELSPPPDGLTISSTGDIAWATDNDDVGAHVVTVEALDLYDLTRPAGHATFTINITGDAAPLTLVIGETIAVVDQAALADFPLILEVVESISVSDAVEVTPPLSIVVVEHVTASDTPTVTPPLVLNIDESVTVEDQTDVMTSLVLSITESLVVSDTPRITPPLLLEIIEAVGVSDSVIVAPDALGDIGGIVWFDTDMDGVRDAAEPPMAAVTVYLDLDDDGLLEPGEPETTSGTDGEYGFIGVVPGSWVVRQVVPTGYDQTFPASTGPHRVVLNAGEAVTDADFGNTQVPNLPPTIVPIDDQFVVAGQELVVNPIATDPEGGQLDHSWSGDIPDTAVINGVFWLQPTTDQTPGVYEITYQVVKADDPTQSASETFRIFVTAPDVPANGPAVVLPSPPTQGGAVVISGQGFEVGSQVGVHLFSTPTFLGTAQVASDGSFTLEATVPQDIELGEHRIVAIGVDESGSLRVLDHAFTLSVDDDRDHDGLTDAEEALTGTDPTIADTDGDGIVDGLDATWLHAFVNNLQNRDLRWGWISRIQLSLAIAAADAAVRNGQRTIATAIIDGLTNATDTCGRTMDRRDLISNCQARSEFADLLAIYRRNVQTMDLPTWQFPWHRGWR